MVTLPVGALLFVLFAWFIGTFAGTVIASFIGTAKATIFATIIGGLIMAASIANMIMIPHPLWFSAIAVAGIAGSAWLGQRLASARGRSPMPGGGD